MPVLVAGSLGASHTVYAVGGVRQGGAEAAGRGPYLLRRDLLASSPRLRRCSKTKLGKKGRPRDPINCAGASAEVRGDRGIKTFIARSKVCSVDKRT